MANYSCINHPEKDYLLILRNWQIEFCDGNKVAAGLLSIFEYWHNIKYTQQEQKAEENRHINDLLQFHSEADLIEKMLSITHTPANIRKGINYLKEKNVISIHRNPNKRYAFDRTRHFLLHPDILNQWLTEREKTKASKKTANNKKKTQKTDSLVTLKDTQQNEEKNPTHPDSTLLFSLLQDYPLGEHIRISSILETLYNPAHYQAIFDEWQHALNQGKVKNKYAYLAGLVTRANKGMFRSTQSQHQQDSQKIATLINVDREKPAPKQAHDIFPHYITWQETQQRLSQQMSKSDYMNFVLPTRAYESDQAIFLRCPNVYAYNFMKTNKDKITSLIDKEIKIYMG